MDHFFEQCFIAKSLKIDMSPFFSLPRTLCRMLPVSVCVLNPLFNISPAAGGNSDACSSSTRSAGRIRQITLLEPRKTAPNFCNKSICAAEHQRKLFPASCQTISTDFREASRTVSGLIPAKRFNGSTYTISRFLFVLFSFFLTV